MFYLLSAGNKIEIVFSHLIHYNLREKSLIIFRFNVIKVSSTEKKRDKARKCRHLLSAFVYLFALKSLKYF